jgi:hypothetical protein
MQLEAAKPAALLFWTSIDTRRINHMKNPSAQTDRQALNDLSGNFIGLCIEIHRELGPGLLESASEECLSLLCASVSLWYKSLI